MSIERYHTLNEPQDTAVDGVKVGLKINDFNNVSAQDLIAQGELEIRVDTDEHTIMATATYAFGETGNPRNGLSAMTTEGIEEVIQKLHEGGAIDAKQKRALRSEIVEQVEFTINQRYGLDTQFIDLTDSIDRRQAIEILDGSPKGKEMVVEDGAVKSIPAQEYQAYQLQKELEEARQMRMA